MGVGVALQAIAMGMGVKMITGDHLMIAKETARQLEMGSDIQTAVNLPMLEAGTNKCPANMMDCAGLVLPADGFAQVFPEHKYIIVEVLRRLGHKTGEITWTCVAACLSQPSLPSSRLAVLSFGVPPAY